MTGNTSAHAGKAEFGGTASTKAAQKILTDLWLDTLIQKESMSLI